MGSRPSRNKVTYFAVVVLGLFSAGVALLVTGHRGLGFGLLIASVTPAMALGTPADFRLGWRRRRR